MMAAAIFEQQYLLRMSS